MLLATNLYSHKLILATFLQTLEIINLGIIMKHDYRNPKVNYNHRYISMNNIIDGRRHSLRGRWKHLQEVKKKQWNSVAKLCSTLWDPVDCGTRGSFVHGISQSRILEWVAISFFRESSRPRDWTWVSCITGRFFTVWATRETRL